MWGGSLRSSLQKKNRKPRSRQIVGTDSVGYRALSLRHDGGMPEPPSVPALLVYQRRVVLRGISPLIWRRLLVRSESTVADVHRTLQVAFGWSDEHLHRFVIHGR